MSVLPEHYLFRSEFKPGVQINFEEYPFNIPAVRGLDGLEFHPKVTFLVGENGSGKSTILEALALGLGYGPEGGTKNAQFSTTDSTSDLHSILRLARGRHPTDGFFLRAESFFNVATYIDQIGYLESYGGKSLHQQSHGESFLALLKHKFRGNGLYLLDEPEAALSPTRQMAALRAIHQLVGERSQFIIATHSPILLAYPDAKWLQLDADGITEISYETCDHVRVTRDFLNHYPDRVSRLLSDD